MTARTSSWAAIVGRCCGSASAPVLVATINFDYVVLHADNQEKMVDVQRK